MLLVGRKFQWALNTYMILWLLEPELIAFRAWNYWSRTPRSGLSTVGKKTKKILKIYNDLRRHTSLFSIKGMLFLLSEWIRHQNFTYKLIQYTLAIRCQSFCKYSLLCLNGNCGSWGFHFDRQKTNFIFMIQNLTTKKCFIPLLIHFQTHWQLYHWFE